MTFSSDLMFGLGETHAQVIDSTWENAINVSGIDNIYNIEMQQKLYNDLKTMDPEFVASGHGSCMKIVK